MHSYRSTDRHPRNHATAAPRAAVVPSTIHVLPEDVPPAEPNSHTAVGGVFDLLLPSLQRAVAEEGYTVPTPIQEKAIPHVLGGRDLLGCAQTGTGKTAAFVLPMLQHVSLKPRPRTPGRPRALILAPTRELAAQIGDSLRDYGRHIAFSQAVIFGGVGQHPQVQALRKGAEILVATPGRLLDLMQQGHLRLEAIELFVLDEADRMLDMGFLPDIRRIVDRLPARRQSLFFSATLQPEVVKLANTMVRDPVHVSVTPQQPTVERINQKVLLVNQSSKAQLLTELLRDPRIDRVLTFTRMKHAANRVAERLEKAGISAVAIHGNKSQNARSKALVDFKTGRVRVLVATDIAARGLDVDGITHVINYDMPVEPETYVHRIGRTARAGAGGDAISFCSADERPLLASIERLIRKPIPVDTDHAYHCAQGGSPGPMPGATRPPTIRPRSRAALPRGRAPHTGLRPRHTACARRRKG